MARRSARLASELAGPCKKKYGSSAKNTDAPEPSPLLAQEVRHADGKTERVFGDGRREVAFANGTLRQQLKDGRAVVRFTNGDVKKTFPSGAPACANLEVT